MSDATPPLSDDLLIGAELIGKYIGLDKRAVYHAAATKQIPVFYVGTKLAARKSELNRRLSSADAQRTPAERDGGA